MLVQLILILACRLACAQVTGHDATIGYDISVRAGSYVFKFTGQATNGGVQNFAFYDTGGLSFVNVNGGLLYPTQNTKGNCPGVTSTFNGINRCLWDIAVVPGKLSNNGVRVEVDTGWDQSGYWNGHFLVGVGLTTGGSEGVSLVSATTKSAILYYNIAVHADDKINEGTFHAFAFTGQATKSLMSNFALYQTDGLSFINVNGQPLYPTKNTKGNCPGVTSTFNGINRCLWDIAVVGGRLNNNGIRVEIDTGWDQSGNWNGYFLVGAGLTTGGSAGVSLYSAKTGYVFSPLPVIPFNQYCQANCKTYAPDFVCYKQSSTSSICACPDGRLRNSAVGGTPKSAGGCNGGGGSIVHNCAKCGDTCSVTQYCCSIGSLNGNPYCQEILSDRHHYILGAP